MSLKHNSCQLFMILFFVTCFNRFSVFSKFVWLRKTFKTGYGPNYYFKPFSPKFYSCWIFTFLFHCDGPWSKKCIYLATYPQGNQYVSTVYVFTVAPGTVWPSTGSLLRSNKAKNFLPQDVTACNFCTIQVMDCISICKAANYLFNFFSWCHSTLKKTV